MKRKEKEKVCYNIVKREAKMQYTIFVRKAPDGFYIASSPLIPEARAQGKTYEECVANMKEVLELCLDFRRERGEEIPQEVSARRVTVAI